MCDLFREVMVYQRSVSMMTTYDLGRDNWDSIVELNQFPGNQTQYLIYPQRYMTHKSGHLTNQDTSLIGSHGYLTNQDTGDKYLIL